MSFHVHIMFILSNASLRFSLMISLFGCICMSVGNHKQKFQKLFSSSLFPIFMIFFVQLCMNIVEKKKLEDCFVTSLTAGGQLAWAPFKAAEASSSF